MDDICSQGVPSCAVPCDSIEQNKRNESVCLLKTMRIFIRVSAIGKEECISVAAHTAINLGLINTNTYIKYINLTK